jgi:hypothetical protein
MGEQIRRHDVAARVDIPGGGLQMRVHLDTA